MYGSLLFLALGALFKNISFITVSLTTVIIIFIVFTAKTEEKEDIKFFGSDYEVYMKKNENVYSFYFLEPQTDSPILTRY